MQVGVVCGMHCTLKCSALEKVLWQARQANFLTLDGGDSGITATKETLSKLRMNSAGWQADAYRGEGGDVQETVLVRIRWVLWGVWHLHGVWGDMPAA